MFNVNDLVLMEDGKYAIVTGIFSKILDDVYAFKGNDFEGLCAVESAHKDWKLANLSAEKAAEVRQQCTGLRDV